jgi:hypothetical protein
VFSLLDPQRLIIDQDLDGLPPEPPIDIEPEVMQPNLVLPARQRDLRVSGSALSYLQPWLVQRVQHSFSQPCKASHAARHASWQLLKLHAKLAFTVRFVVLSVT